MLNTSDLGKIIIKHNTKFYFKFISLSLNATIRQNIHLKNKYLKVCKTCPIKTHEKWTSIAEHNQTKYLTTCTVLVHCNLL